VAAFPFVSGDSSCVRSTEEFLYGRYLGMYSSFNVEFIGTYIFLFGKSRTVACSPGPAYKYNKPCSPMQTFSVIRLALFDTSYTFKEADMPHLGKTVKELLIPC
jgi:hypothetical protein